MKAISILTAPYDSSVLRTNSVSDPVLLMRAEKRKRVERWWVDGDRNRKPV